MLRLNYGHSCLVGRLKQLVSSRNVLFAFDNKLHSLCPVQSSSSKLTFLGFSIIAEQSSSLSIARKMSSSEKERYLSMSLEEKRKEYSIKGKHITLDQIPTWSAYAVTQNLAKTTDSREFPVNDDHNRR